MNKILVVFYSQKGHTRKAAQAIAQALSCDLEEIQDLKKRTGLWGFIRGAFDARGEKLTEIAPTVKTPGDYDMVILGTPVWAGTMTPALRTYISLNCQGLNKVAYFMTMGSSGDKQTIRALEEITSPPQAVLALRQKDIDAGQIQNSVEAFVSSLRISS